MWTFERILACMSVACKGFFLTSIKDSRMIMSDGGIHFAVFEFRSVSSYIQNAVHCGHARLEYEKDIANLLIY